MCGPYHTLLWTSRQWWIYIRQGCIPPLCWPYPGGGGGMPALWHCGKADPPFPPWPTVDKHPWKHYLPAKFPARTPSPKFPKKPYKFMACSHNTGLGTRNDGFLYYTMYCTHYTVPGEGYDTIVFYCVTPVPCPVQCEWAITNGIHKATRLPAVGRNPLKRPFSHPWPKGLIVLGESNFCQNFGSASAL